MDEEIKKLLEQNLEMTKEIHDMVHKIKNYINLQKFLSLFYFLLIVAPIILGLIYLPPLLKGLYSQYTSILNIPDTGIEMPNLDEILKSKPDINIQ